MKEIARDHDASAVQIPLVWVLRPSGVQVIPKAVSVKHVEENFQCSSIALTAEEKSSTLLFQPLFEKHRLGAI